MSFYGLDAYELLKEEQLDDIDSIGYIVRHKKSGARLVLVSNDDDNKVFYVAFKTPPTDETGVPHIIEHTVLCGSDKFPVKDPFIELVKGSLNTFLNAITYPDKTMYPAASYNDKDFKNLMDVYMDAVFHPNILKYEEIFKQEGWHYELEEKDAPLSINGVVYNEMKGAYSSPDEMLQREIYMSLFPHNTYSKDSGGNPDAIPTLTYEDFVNFYKKYYHPSNSYIYLYGDFDIQERLEWIDKMYLSSYDVLEVDSAIEKEPAFTEVKQVDGVYPIALEESPEDKTYFSYCKVIGDALNTELCYAFEVLEYALVTAPGAPVRQALIDAGIGQDVYGDWEDSILQPVFSITAKNANSSDKERFVAVIEDTLRKIVEEGVNEKSLLAAINSSEFRFREADYGHFPKGLLYGISCMDSWLFDDMQPFLNLQCLDTYAKLKEKIGTGYYEELITKFLLDNQHGTVVMLAPKPGLNKEKEDALEAQLQAYKATLSEEEIQRLIDDTNALWDYQQKEASEEELATIPMLERKDLRKNALPYSNIETQIGDVPVVLHDYFTNGIDYVTFYFDIEDIQVEDLPYVGLLKSVLGFIDTDTLSYAQIANEINIYTGGISSGFNVYADAKEHGCYKVKYEFRTKVLEDNLAKSLQIMQDIILHSKLDDVKRLTEILAQTKSRLQSMISSSGHVFAAQRSLSYISKYAFYQDVTLGVAYYDAICQMNELIKSKPEVIVEKLRALVAKIMVQSRMLISFTAKEDGYEKAHHDIEEFIASLPVGEPVNEVAEFVLDKKNEGITDASTIVHVARGGNYVDHGYAYTGILHILKGILGCDYLWNKVRIAGGAYGCMSSFLRSGEAYFASYRDPKLSQTNEVYENIPKYLREFDVDEREMTKYVIGTFGSMDTPLNPEAKGSRSMTAYLRKLELEEVQKDRDEILNAQPEDIRALADLIESVLSDDCICVIGNENMIQKEKDLFLNIRNISE